MLLRCDCDCRCTLLFLLGSFSHHHRHIYVHLRVRIKSYLRPKLGLRAGRRGTSESVGSVLTDNAAHIRIQNKTALR